MEYNPKSLPKSHFWIHGIVPIIIGMGMALLPKFIPFPSQESGELIIVVALIPIIYGMSEIIRYLGRYWRSKSASA
ncbi:MAG: hypothetical protein Q7K44_04820 [Candidatus Liptonbacteria bacterium]|nr:hypothetical protein [Candidatus Liptonbacteria bacterium]